MRDRLLVQVAANVDASKKWTFVIAEAMGIIDVIELL
jgi:hypothetical protein